MLQHVKYNIFLWIYQNTYKQATKIHQETIKALMYKILISLPDKNVSYNDNNNSIYYIVHYNHYALCTLYIYFIGHWIIIYFIVAI